MEKNVQKKGSRALIAAATALAVTTTGLPTAGAAAGLTSSEMQECVDYLVPQFRAESNGFWDPEIDKELAITVSHGGGSFCSETAGARSYLNDANDGEMMKMNKQGWSAALAVYRLPLVAAIVLPILAVLGGGAFAAQQGLIPGL